MQGTVFTSTLPKLVVSAVCWSIFVVSDVVLEFSFDFSVSDQDSCSLKWPECLGTIKKQIK